MNHIRLFFIATIMMTLSTSSFTEVPEDLGQSQKKSILAFFRGEIKIIRLGQEFNAIKKMKLKHGDAIWVKRKSLAVIKSRASIIKLSENTYYKLDLSKPEILNGRLSKGALVVQFLKSKLSLKPSGKKAGKPPMVIKTKNVALGVRGTKFFVYQGEKADALATVHHGKVEMKGRTPGNKLHLEDNQSSMTNANRKVIAPKTFGHEEKINWNLEASSKATSREAEDLEHHPELYTHIEKIWEQYKKEQAVNWKNKINKEQQKFESQKNDMEDRFKNMFPGQ